MWLSVNGLTLLMNLEGFRPFVYDDATGKPVPRGRKPIGKLTIGYGHVLSPTEKYPTGISRLEAQSLLKTDVLEAEGEVRDFCELHKIELTQNQFDATILLVFNCGPLPLHQGFGEMLKKHLWIQSADRMLLWHNVERDGVLIPNAGLKARRKRERELFLAA